MESSEGNVEAKRKRKGLCQAHHHGWKYKDRGSSRKGEGEGKGFQIPKSMGIKINKRNNQGNHPTIPNSGGHHNEAIIGGVYTTRPRPGSHGLQNLPGGRSQSNAP